MFLILSFQGSLEFGILVGVLLIIWLPFFLNYKRVTIDVKRCHILIEKYFLVVRTKKKLISFQNITNYHNKFSWVYIENEENEKITLYPGSRIAGNRSSVDRKCTSILFGHEYRVQSSLKKIIKTEKNDIGRFIGNIDYSKTYKDILFLSLRDMNISQVSNVDFQNEENNIVGMDLSCNNITDLRFLKDFPKLEILIINSCQIQELTNEEGQLENIRHLKINNNQISHFEINNALEHLTKLELVNNSISIIPDLGFFPCLKTVDLNNNSISEISDIISPNDKLQTLNLSNNKISNIIDICNQKSLIYLHLNNNNLTSIPRFENLPSLKWLDLSENNIQDIENLDCLQSLVYLSLRNNQITGIKNLAKLKNLQVLNLSGNKISGVKGLGNLMHLKKLYLRNIPISKQELRKLNKLKKKGVVICT